LGIMCNLHGLSKYFAGIIQKINLTNELYQL
jgi:hypothetical protein